MPNPSTRVLAISLVGAALLVSSTGRAQADAPPDTALAPSPPAPARPNAPDASEIARVGSALERARYASVSIGARRFTLEHPYAEPAGLAFERAIEPPRRAVVLLGPRDTVPPPASPIPWERIDALEAGVMQRRSNIAIGAGMGLVLAFGLALAAHRFVGGLEIDPGDAFTVLGLPSILVGAGIGALVSTPSWHPVRPPEPGAPADTLR